MMQPIADRRELLRWTAVAGDDPQQSFETAVGQAFAFRSYSDYSALFLPETIAAACAWSVEHDLRPFAMFFTIPEPAGYAAESGSFSGVVATGTDDPKSIESFLTHDNRWRGYVSLYDMSHRFIVVPDDRSWLWIGDRDADLAIFGFSTEAQQREFVRKANFGMFASLDEAAEHAMSFMNYPLDKTCFG